MYAFLRGIPVAGKQLICICTWYWHSLEATCMHFYVLFHVILRSKVKIEVFFAERGGTLYAFLRGIRIAGKQLVCIFTWYSCSWEATCMHFYVFFLT